MKKFAVILSVLAALGLTACGGAKTGDNAKPADKPKSALPDVIKIGTIQPNSGAIAKFGQQTTQAIQMAVEEINAAGGISGKKVEVIVEDDENNPEKTTNAYTKLTNKDKVAAIIGALTSKCTLAIAKQAQSDGVILLSPTSTNDTVTLAGNYVFRACYTDSFQGKVVAKYASETLKAKKAAVLYDVSNDYSKGLFKNFEATFTSLGGTVTSEVYSNGAKDFKAQITKIKSAGVDVIFIPDYYNTVTLIAKQVRELGMNIPLLGSDGWDEVTSTSNKELLNSFFSNHYSPESQDAEVQAFITKFKAKYNETPNALAALGYDSTYILLNAIKEAGTTDSKYVRDSLAKSTGKYVTGNISFDENRNPVKSAVMLEIVKNEKGELTTKYAGTVNP